MRHNIKQALDKLFHDSAIAELRLLHNGTSDASLTYNDILYLSIIEAHDGEYTASNIADMLHVSRPAVTQKINELAKGGYINRVQSAGDKRVYQLFTNRASKSKAYYETVDKTDAAISAKLAQKYSAEQIALFCEMTDAIGQILLNETPDC